MKRTVYLPLAGTPIPGEWAERAACRKYPTQWWFPDGQWGAAKEDARTAKRICRELCPVREECLDHAVRYRELGIWGGTQESERRWRRKAS